MNKLLPVEWMATMGNGVRTVVIDTGFDPATPWVFPHEVRSFLLDGQLGDPTDHGSQVASIIAGHSPTHMGMAPACDLYIARAVDSNRHWDPLRDAMQWALQLKAQVVNMSFAFEETDREFFDLIWQLAKTGCIIVAAHAPSRPWPHRHPAVISVAADDLVEHAAIAAPGMTSPPLKMRSGKLFRGSSVASAIVAGIAACAKAADHTLTRQQFITGLA